MCSVKAFSALTLLVGWQEGHAGEWWRWALVSPDGVAPSWIVSVSAFVNLPLHHKVQKFSSGTGSPGWSPKKGRKMVVVWWLWCAVGWGAVGVVTNSSHGFVGQHFSHWHYSFHWATASHHDTAFRLDAVKMASCTGNNHTEWHGQMEQTHIGQIIYRQHYWNPLKFAEVPQTNEKSQPLVGRSSPCCKDVGEILLLNKFFVRLSIRALVAKI